MNEQEKEDQAPAAAPAESHGSSATAAHSAEADRFDDLASSWKRETRFYSSRNRITDHPAYKEIIRMGPAVLPLIIRELRQEPRYWFAALTAITGEDPVPAEDRGLVRKMTEAWLRWGKEHGF